MNTKTIKKEIALFLLAGYETGEVAVNTIIKERTKLLTLALLCLIMVITVCKFRPEMVAVYDFLLVALKWSIPTVFLSATTVRYLLG